MAASGPTLDDDLTLLADTIAKVVEEHLCEHGITRQRRKAKNILVKGKDVLAASIFGALSGSRAVFSFIGDFERQMLECATAFAVDSDGGTLTRVERRAQLDGPDMWAVCRLSECLNKLGEWEHEPMPSSRTEEFKDRTRWLSREDAFAAWKNNKGEGGSTVGPERGRSVSP